MGLSIDDFFTANSVAQAEILAEKADDVVPRILPEPGKPGAGEYLFALKSWRLGYNIFRNYYKRLHTETASEIGMYFEKIAELFTLVLDNLDTVFNHSKIRICIYDECAELFKPEDLDRFPERHFQITPHNYPVEREGIWVVFSADVQFNSVQSLIRTLYSFDNCFAICGLEYPDSNSKDEWHKQFGDFTYRKVDDISTKNFDMLDAFNRLITKNIICQPVYTRQELLKDLLNMHTYFNSYQPSLRAYNYLCDRLNTNLSHGMFNYSIQLKTKQILNHITELEIDFYIKNKLDYCTIDVHKAMKMNRHRCFFVTDDIGLNIAANHKTVDFDDVEDGEAQTLTAYFEENDYQMKSDGSLFAVAELMNENVDYLVSIFRIGALEFPNIFHSDSKAQAFLKSPYTIKETGFTVCTKLSNPDTAFDRHFELLRELIIDKNNIEYEEIKYSVKNWYISRNISQKDYMWK